MNINHRTLMGRGALFAALFAIPGTQLVAGTFSADFNDAAVPVGTAVYGNTLVDSSGGAGGSGVLKLTQAINGQVGSFVIDDLDPGSISGVNSFTAAFKVRIGGGTATPADGFSFAAGPDLPAAGWSEEGPTTTGLVVAFDIYDNGGGGSSGDRRPVERHGSAAHGIPALVSPDRCRLRGCLDQDRSRWQLRSHLQRHPGLLQCVPPGLSADGGGEVRLWWKDRRTE